MSPPRRLRLRRWRRRRHDSSQHEPVLGTVLSFDIEARGRHAPRRAEQLLLGEIRRLERVYSIFLADSELNRWKRADGDAPASDDLTRLLRLGLRWQLRTGGLFNPAVGLLTDRWQRAADTDAVPDPAELAELASLIAEPRYDVTAQGPRKRGDCSPLDFNALAKGLIVDLAARRVRESVDVDRLVVNIGGDLLHAGSGGALVGVEDPRRPFDNMPPLVRVMVRDGGLATTGSARRGQQIGGRWYSHVIDPRTGQPAHTVASASVVAADAATADVVATALGIVDPAVGLALAASLRRDDGLVACCIVDAAGVIHVDDEWQALSA